MLSEEQLSTARAMSSVQDPKSPYLIHRKNGRLLPNTKLLRKHKDLVPYSGSVKASLDERMRYLRTGSAGARDVLAPDPAESAPPFDISKASRDELLEFARQEYGIELNAAAPSHILRKQILKAAGIEPAGEGETPLS